MNTILEPRKKLGAAILRIIVQANPTPLYMPYLSSMLYGFIRKEMPEAMKAALIASGLRPTLGVSKVGVLYYCPEFIAASTVDEVALALIHETMHSMLDHHGRAAAVCVDPAHFAIANLAQDASINEELERAGHKLPKWWIRPEHLQQPRDLAWEDRWRRLMKDAHETGGGTAGSTVGPGLEQDDGNGNGDGDGGAGKPGSGKGKQPGKGGVGAGTCGSVSGNPLPGEPSLGDGRSEAQMDRLRRQAAQDIREYVEGNKGRGTVPDTLVRWADEILKPPRIDWREQLRVEVQTGVAYRPGSVDFDWTRMSRRQAGIGYGVGKPIVPSYRAPVPRIACVVDTSGSMGVAELDAALAEISGVCETVGAEVLFGACDAALHELKEIRDPREALALLKGGGGTDMAPAMNALSEADPRPEIVIVLTDGYIGDGYPAEEPLYKTIWVLIGNDQAEGFGCPWGTRIHIPVEAASEAA